MTLINTPSGSITEFDDGVKVTRLFCTPPAQKLEPVRVPPTDSALGVCTLPYVFTWNDRGPMAKRFEYANDMLHFGIGWCKHGGVLSMVSPFEFRGA